MLQVYQFLLLLYLFQCFFESHRAFLCLLYMVFFDCLVLNLHFAQSPRLFFILIPYFGVFTSIRSYFLSTWYFDVLQFCGETLNLCSSFLALRALHLTAIQPKLWRNTSRTLYTYTRIQRSYDLSFKLLCNVFLLCLCCKCQFRVLISHLTALVLTLFPFGKGFLTRFVRY